MLASLLPLLGPPQLSAKPGPFGPASPLPPPVKAQVAKPETWRIKPVPSPPERDSDSNRVIVDVAGKRVVLVPRDGYNKIDGVEKGRDGSLLVHRAKIGDPRWEFQDFIWYQGRETPIRGASVYLDRRNYAGSSIRETNAMGTAESAPEAHAIENGKPRALGWGSVRAWIPDGTFVLEVPVGEGGQPTGTEFTTGSVTRILSRKGEWRIPDYGYAGRMKDGSLVLVSGATSSSVGNGFVSLAKAEVAQSRVLFWKDGRFAAHVETPAGWRIVGLAPDGWLLVRRTAAPVAEPSFEGVDAKNAMATMERWQKTQGDLETEEERDWSAGVLRGNVLTPIGFPRPKGTEKLLWRGGGAAYGPSAFRFVAFWGDDERRYRVYR